MSAGGKGCPQGEEGRVLRDALRTQNPNNRKHTQSAALASHSWPPSALSLGPPHLCSSLASRPVTSLCGPWTGLADEVSWLWGQCWDWTLYVETQECKVIVFKSLSATPPPLFLF